MGSWAKKWAKQIMLLVTERSRPYFCVINGQSVVIYLYSTAARSIHAIVL